MENPMPVLPRTKADKISLACYPSSPHSFKNTTVCRSEGMLWLADLYAKRLPGTLTLLHHPPACPLIFTRSQQGLWLCTVPKTSNDSLSTCLSPRGNRKPSLASCDCQISPWPFCSQAVQNYSGEGCLLSKATSPGWGNVLTPGLCSCKGI